MAKVYISGPMSGLPDFNRPAFAAKEAELLAAGHEVVSPHHTPEQSTWEEYLRYDLKLMLDCDSIYILPGWSNSKGARLEVSVALSLLFDVISPEETLMETPA